MTSVTLHYIYDPLCGWCYGAAPLLQAARAVLPVVAHGGGMMSGSNRQNVSPQLRNFVMPHDRRIAQLTGQPFGDAYFEGLLCDHSALFDSEPPIAAMLAADYVAGRGLDLLARLQTAHYVEGRRICEAAVLAELAEAIGLERNAFAAAFEQVANDGSTQTHIGESRALLARAGGQGFPTFVLDRDGHLETIDIGPYHRHADAWQSWLSRSVAPVAAASTLPGD
jgi:putative protein-disulfide isomerase